MGKLLVKKHSFMLLITVYYFNLLFEFQRNMKNSLEQMLFSIILYTFLNFNFERHLRGFKQIVHYFVNIWHKHYDDLGYYK